MERANFAHFQPGANDGVYTFANPSAAGLECNSFWLVKEPFVYKNPHKLKLTTWEA